MGRAGSDEMGRAGTGSAKRGGGRLPIPSQVISWQNLVTGSGLIRILKACWTQIGKNDNSETVQARVEARTERDDQSQLNSRLRLLCLTGTGPH